MKDKFFDFIEKIDIHVIFLRIVKLFITACGITLLLCFFNEDVELYTRENIVRFVSSIFFIECIISMISKVFIFFDTWFSTGTRVWQDNAMASLKENSLIECSKTKQIITVHEAGHAVMAYLKDAKKFDIDLVNNCVNTSYSIADVEEWKNCIMVKYAGAAAEELIFGQFCSGCFGSGTADFESATEFIKGYILMTDNMVSKSMLEEEIGQKIIALSNELYNETLELLSQHEDMVQHLANILKIKNYLSTEEVREILSQFII